MKEKKNLLWLFALVMMLCILPAGTVKAATVYHVRYHESSKAYYLYNQYGKTVKSTQYSVYKLDKLSANGKNFQGLYCVTGNGRIISWSTVVYIPATKNVGGVAYGNGYYYTDSQGRIKQKSGLLQMNKRTVNNKVFNGTYYYDLHGKIQTVSAVRRLNIKYNNLTYTGYYYFGGKYGAIGGKQGLITHNNKLYYVTNKYGKCLSDADRTVNGKVYRFASNGVGKLLTADMQTLKSKLTSMTKSYGGSWSIYIKKLDSNQSFIINDRAYYAASEIKPFVMAAVYDQINKKKMTLTSTVSSNLWDMITVSSNDACNELVIKLGNGKFLNGRDVLNSYNQANGYTKTAIHHTLLSTVYNVSDGSQNTTSAKDCGLLLERIYKGTCVNSAYSKKMLNSLLNQQRRWKIPAGLPSGTKVANKTGENGAYEHDIAIVYGPKCDYIICVMSEGSSGSISKIREISKTVYNYLEK